MIFEEDERIDEVENYDDEENVVLEITNTDEVYLYRDFYIYAPGSLALLIHPRALNFCSIFPTPLPETLITGHNGRCRRVKGLTVNSD